VVTVCQKLEKLFFSDFIEQLVKLINTSKVKFEGHGAAICQIGKISVSSKLHIAHRISLYSSIVGILAVGRAESYGNLYFMKTKSIKSGKTYKNVECFTELFQMFSSFVRIFSSYLR
jgi:hypothetical protein